MPTFITSDNGLFSFRIKKSYRESARKRTVRIIIVSCAAVSKRESGFENSNLKMNSIPAAIKKYLILEYFIVSNIGLIITAYRILKYSS
jgi:hypothetical protein